MIHWLIGRLGIRLFRMAMAVRYRVQMVGLEQIRKRKRSGGILFLPNHPAHMDPIILCTRLWNKWKVRPMVAERVYFLPGLHYCFHAHMRAVAVPGFERASNTFKVMRSDRATQKIIDGLKNGENFVVYPSGRLKRTPEERIGGASAVFEVLKQVPEANVVMVRTTGLWGSMFSWGLTGRQPDLGKGLKKGMSMALRHLFFFVPKRELKIEFELAGDELYRQEKRSDFNRWLEQWYNKEGPEALKLVSYSRWRTEFPNVTYSKPYHEADIDQIPIRVRRQVIREIARLSHKKTSEIQPGMHLFTDLSLDSLDIADLISSLERVQGVSGTRWDLDLLTVGSVMAMVAGKLEARGTEEPPEPVEGWEETKRPAAKAPVGKTLIEAFLRTCDRMGKAVACADELSGVLTYEDLKTKALILASMIREMPGRKIGIMLPSTVAVEVVVLACLLAGKIPVMINWTVGKRYLEHVKDVSGIKVVISSWAFLDNLDGADLTPIHEMIVTLEAIRVDIGYGDLKKGKKLAKKNAGELLKHLKLDHVRGEATAVILFTSGTEALPKCVPLTHHNLLSNHRACFERLGGAPKEIFYSVLPPFHSLGFSITGLLPLLSGLKVVYGPDPTDGPQMVRDIMRYKPTFLCLAPTFLSGLFNIARPGQLSSIRVFVSGAEKAPPDLRERAYSMGPDVEFLEGYGITECSPVITLTTPGKPPVGVGEPLPGVEVCVVDPETKEPLGVDEVGLVLAHGPGVFGGYLHEAVSSPFVELDGKRWYNSGDLGKLNQEGSLILAGRLKRFVKIGGEMVSLPAVEAGLQEAAINDNWGGGRQDRMLGVVAVETDRERPALYLFANFFIDLEEANEALRKGGFSNLARIKAFHHLPEMPLMGTGKVAFRKLQEEAEKLDADLREKEKA